jgi:hypothetical protein
MEMLGLVVEVACLVTPHASLDAPSLQVECKHEGLGVSVTTRTLRRTTDGAALLRSNHESAGNATFLFR